MVLEYLQGKPLGELIDEDERRCRPRAPSS